MMRKKIICLFVVAAALSTNVSAQIFYKAYNKYIDAYRNVAMETMQQFNVPASILLAQGMLESMGGTSPEAVQANNHFGIKCYDTEGETFLYKSNEFATEMTCYQKYASVAESFADQARIFRLHSRYKILQQYTPDNYVAWARALQHAGYATSPEYADNLINLIRHYKLYKYDRQVLKQRESDNKKGTVANQSASNTQAQAEAERAQRQARENAEKAQQQAKAEAEKAQKQAREEAEKAQKNAAKQEAAAAAARAELPVVVNQSFNVGETRLIREYDVDRINDVKFIMAQEGDSYFNIARKFGIDLQDLRRYNDVPTDMEMALGKGDLVFLQLKRHVAARGYSYHQVQEGESMHSIAQMYAIRMANLYNLNKMKPSDKLSVGQILRLR